MSPTSRLRPVALAALLALAGAPAFAFAAAPAPAATAPATTPAAPRVPALAVTTLDGRAWDIAEQRGSWVFVNYWATWCAPCLREMPELDELDHARDDLVVIGLAYEETTEDDLRAALAQRPVRYPIALVDVFAPPPDFDVPRGLPMSWLINPRGEIVKPFLGPVTGAEIEAAIAEAQAADAAG